MLVEDVDVVFVVVLRWFGVTPLVFQGESGDLGRRADAVVELADVIVPGHGPVGGEPAVRELQAYLRACIEAQGDPLAIPSGPWDTWLDREHDAINVERTAMLARGDDDIPFAMLDAMGLA